MKWIGIIFKTFVVLEMSSCSWGIEEQCDVTKWLDHILTNLQKDTLSSRQRAELSNVQEKKNISCLRLKRTHKFIVSSVNFDESKYKCNDDKDKKIEIAKEPISVIKVKDVKEEKNDPKMYLETSGKDSKENSSSTTIEIIQAQNDKGDNKEETKKDSEAKENQNQVDKDGANDKLKGFPELRLIKDQIENEKNSAFDADCDEDKEKEKMKDKNMNVRKNSAISNDGVRYSFEGADNWKCVNESVKMKLEKIDIRADIKEGREEEETEINVDSLNQGVVGDFQGEIIENDATKIKLNNLKNEDLSKNKDLRSLWTESIYVSDVKNDENTFVNDTNAMEHLDAKEELATDMFNLSIVPGNESRSITLEDKDETSHNHSQDNGSEKTLERINMKETFKEGDKCSCVCGSENVVTEQRLRNVEDKVGHLHKMYRKSFRQARGKLQKLEIKIKRLLMERSKIRSRCRSSLYRGVNEKNGLVSEDSVGVLDKGRPEENSISNVLADCLAKEDDGIFCYESDRCRFVKLVLTPFCRLSYQSNTSVKKISRRTAANEESLFEDCRQIKQEREISTFFLLGDNRLHVRLLCKNESIVLLQRISGLVNFTRNWKEYKYGFGELNNSFWLGLEIIYQLTQRDDYKLLIELKDWENNSYSGVYNQFKVDSELQGYRLRIGDFHGDSGDGLGPHNNMKFSTIDVDNDEAVTKFGGSCSNRFRGGWWYFSCYKCNPTGIYYDLGLVDSQRFDGISWKPLKPPTYSFQKIVMSIQKI